MMGRALLIITSHYRSGPSGTLGEYVYVMANLFTIYHVSMTFLNPRLMAKLFLTCLPTDNPNGYTFRNPEYNVSDYFMNQCCW